MKVCQEIDVDNITIIVNPQNQLESQVVIEEVTGLNMPVTLTKEDTEYSVSKVGKLTGTDWLVFQAEESTPPVKETIRIPIGIKVQDMVDKTHIRSGRHEHTIDYRTILSNDLESPGGIVRISSNANLMFIMDGRSTPTGDGKMVTKTIPLPDLLSGEFKLSIDYVTSTTESKIESATASGTITVETEDKIYEYELISHVAVDNYS